MHGETTSASRTQSRHFNTQHRQPVHYTYIRYWYQEVLLIENIVPNAPELFRYELRTNQQGFLTRARRGAPRHLVLCRGASTGRVRVVEAEREGPPNHTSYYDILFFFPLPTTDKAHREDITKRGVGPGILDTLRGRESSVHRMQNAGQDRAGHAAAGSEVTWDGDSFGLPLLAQLTRTCQLHTCMCIPSSSSFFWQTVSIGVCCPGLVTISNVCTLAIYFEALCLDSPVL